MRANKQKKRVNHLLIDASVLNGRVFLETETLVPHNGGGAFRFPIKSIHKSQGAGDFSPVCLTEAKPADSEELCSLSDPFFTRSNIHAEHTFAFFGWF